MNKVKFASPPHETNVVFLLSGQSFLLWMEPTHMDEPQCIILSDLFLSQVGTQRPRKGNHFFVGWWASHTIQIIFLQSATTLSLEPKTSCERKITVMGRTSLQAKTSIRASLSLVSLQSTCLWKRKLTMQIKNLRKIQTLWLRNHTLLIYTKTWIRERECYMPKKCNEVLIQASKTSKQPNWPQIGDCLKKIMMIYH